MYNFENLIIVSGCKLCIIITFHCILHESIYNCMLLFVSVFNFLSVLDYATLFSTSWSRFSDSLVFV